MRRVSFQLTRKLSSKSNPQPFSKSRGVQKVRLKWVRNKGLDHVIDKDTDVKAACVLKDAIHRSPTGFLTEKTFSPWKTPLGLTVPVLRFLRRYPTLFRESPHARYPRLPCFSLTDTAKFLDSMERRIHAETELEAVHKLCRLLMMSRSRTVPYKTLLQMRWDLGLSDDFMKSLVPKYPDHFQPLKSSSGAICLRLAKWRDELAVSSLQRANERSVEGDEYRSFKLGSPGLTFPMNYPRRYGERNKVIAWMSEFDRLPYVSPYEDSSRIDPKSDLMEKRVVGVLHETLSLTLHKKTRRDFISGVREDYNLPERFTRIFTRFPGVFYLSLKCKTTTAVLREGYKSAKLVEPHPLTKVRDKFHYVMRTGIMYRTKGEAKFPNGEISGDREAKVPTENVAPGILAGYKSGDDGGEEFGDEDEDGEFSGEEVSDYEDCNSRRSWE